MTIDTMAPWHHGIALGYAVLMEDARLAFGAFEPASCLRLEFLAQGKAFQDLTLAVWRQGPSE